MMKIHFTHIHLLPLVLLQACLLAASASLAQQASETTVTHTATLTEIQGEVLVFQGEKYVPAKLGMRVKNGDRILVLQDGEAKIRYIGSCTETAVSSSIYIVDRVGSCGGVLPAENIAGTAATKTRLVEAITIATIGIIILDEMLEPLSP